MSGNVNAQVFAVDDEVDDGVDDEVDDEAEAGTTTAAAAAGKNRGEARESDDKYVAREKRDAERLGFASPSGLACRTSSLQTQASRLRCRNS